MAGQALQVEQSAAAGAPLTEPSLIKLDFVPPAPQLAPFVTTFYHFHCAEQVLRDMIPAGVGYLVVVLRGTGVMTFADGRREQADPVALQTPSTHAAMLDATGPVQLFAATLSPLGWMALTGLDADRSANRLLDARTVLGDDVDALAAGLRAAVKAGAPDSALAEIMSAFIAPRLRPLNPRHVALVKQVGDWLSASFDPPLDELREAAGYSLRQVERLVRRYFGVAPRLLVRKYRIMRVAALLQAPDTGPEQIAELLNLFYDQSHFIREMRLFMGRTPTALAGEGDSILGQMSGMRVYREVKPNFARLPGD